jgi:hypothetical protein
VLVGDWIGIRREAVDILRRSELAAWIIDRPPPSFLKAVENLRPREPAYNPTVFDDCAAGLTSPPYGSLANETAKRLRGVLEWVMPLSRTGNLLGSR